MLHTESFDTLYSVVTQTLTLLCGASCLLLSGRSHRQRLVGELPESPSTMNPFLGVVVAGAQPHDAHHSQLVSSSSHSMWIVVAPG
jgi:hypothetical protein